MNNSFNQISSSSLSFNSSKHCTPNVSNICENQSNPKSKYLYIRGTKFITKHYWKSIESNISINKNDILYFIKNKTSHPGWLLMKFDLDKNGSNSKFWVPDNCVELYNLKSDMSEDNATTLNTNYNRQESLEQSLDELDYEFIQYDSYNDNRNSLSNYKTIEGLPNSRPNNIKLKGAQTTGRLNNKTPPALPKISKESSKRKFKTKNKVKTPKDDNFGVDSDDGLISLEPNEIDLTPTLVKNDSKDKNVNQQVLNDNITAMDSGMSNLSVEVKSISRHRRPKSTRDHLENNKVPEDLQNQMFYQAEEQLPIDGYIYWKSLTLPNGNRVHKKCKWSKDYFQLSSRELHLFQLQIYSDEKAFNKGEKAKTSFALNQTKATKVDKNFQDAYFTTNKQNVIILDRPAHDKAKIALHIPNETEYEKWYSKIVSASCFSDNLINLGQKRKINYPKPNYDANENRISKSSFEAAKKALYEFFRSKGPNENTQRKHVKDRFFGLDLSTCSEDTYHSLINFIQLVISEIINFKFDSVPGMSKEEIQYIKDQGLDNPLATEGLYRVNANKATLQSYRIHLDENYSDVHKIAKMFKKEKDIHNLTGIIKYYFREMKNLLIANQFLVTFNEIYDKYSVTNRQKLIELTNEQIFTKLNLRNQKIISILALHVRDVIENPHNKMTQINISNIFGPTMCETSSTLSNNGMDILKYSQYANQLMDIIFDKEFSKYLNP